MKKENAIINIAFSDFIQGMVDQTRKIQGQQPERFRNKQAEKKKDGMMETEKKKGVKIVAH